MVARLRAKVQFVVRVVFAGHLDRKHSSPFGPKTELPTCQLVAAGARLEMDQFSVEMTFVGKAQGRRTCNFHSVIRGDETAIDRQLRTGTAAWGWEHSGSVQNWVLVKYNDNGNSLRMVTPAMSLRADVYCCSWWSHHK